MTFRDWAPTQYPLGYVGFDCNVEYVRFARVEWKIPNVSRYYDVIHAFARTTVSLDTVGPPWGLSRRDVSLCGVSTYGSSGARPTSTWCATCEVYAESFKRLVRDYAEARDREIDRAWAT